MRATGHLFLSSLIMILTLFSGGLALSQTLEAVRLGPGDVIGLKFQGRDSLNGDYIIGVEGSLFFPGIGPVQAADRTLTEIAQDLDGLMRENFGLDSRTFSIAVTEFRPIYVGGRVRQPGSYQFRPGLRVAHAIAMAGGPRGLNADQPIVALETGREYARLRVTEDQLANAVLQRNRLLARLGMPADDSVSEDDIRDMIGSLDTEFRVSLQQSLNDMQTRVDGIQRNVLTLRAETAQGEAEALQSQLEALGELLKISADELAILEDPSERGIIPRARILELQRLVASTNGEISATLARRFSAESDQRAFEGDARIIDEARRLQDLLQLSLVDGEVSGLRRQVRAIRATLDDVGGLPAEDTEICGIEIWRNETSELNIFVADQTVPLQPGDFVRLVQKSSDGSCDRQRQ